jgi:hypothetical protein
MSIQMFKDLQEATDNAKAMVEGLKGLGEHIFPADKLHARVDFRMREHHEVVDSQIKSLLAAQRATIERCEQLTGEAVQLSNSITARYEERFLAIEARLSAIEDILEGFIAAAGRRRR